MKIDEVEIAPTLDPSDIIQDDEFEVEEDTSAEENLSEALSLLEDMSNLMQALLEPRLNRQIPVYNLKQMFKLTQEVDAFLHQYEMPDHTTDIDKIYD